MKQLNRCPHMKQVDECLTCQQQRVQALENEVEQRRVQLAGCLTVADGNTSNPATPKMFGWSPAYQAVLDLRIKFDGLRAKPKKIKGNLHFLRTGDCLTVTLRDITGTVLCDYGTFHVEDNHCLVLQAINVAPNVVDDGIHVGLEIDAPIKIIVHE